MDKKGRCPDLTPVTDSTSPVPVTIVPKLADGERRPQRKLYLIELCVFLLLIVPPAIFYYLSPDTGKINLMRMLAGTAVVDVGLGGLVVFFAWRNREPLWLFGLTMRNFWGEIGIGISLFPLFLLGIGLISVVLKQLGFQINPFSSVVDMMHSQGWLSALGEALLLIVIATVEEIVFRGYLIRRLTLVGNNTAIAVVLSSVIFAFGHGYEGWAGVITVGIDGLIFAMVYLWRRSLVASVVMHFLLDLFAIVIVPVTGTSIHYLLTKG